MFYILKKIKIQTLKYYSVEVLMQQKIFNLKRGNIAPKKYNHNKELAMNVLNFF